MTARRAPISVERMARAARIDRIILTDAQPAPMLPELATAWVAVQAEIAQSDAAIRKAEGTAEALKARQAKAAEASVGLPALLAAEARLFEKSNQLAAKIRIARPATVEEAAIKLAAILADVGDGSGGIDNPRPLYDFLGDLEHLAQRNRQT